MLPELDIFATWPETPATAQLPDVFGFNGFSVKPRGKTAQDAVCGLAKLAAICGINAAANGDAVLATNVFNSLWNVYKPLTAELRAFETSAASG